LFLNKHMYIDRHSIRVVLGSRMSWSTCCCITWFTAIICNRQIGCWWSYFYDILWRLSYWQRYCN
jgi:hypothetical protein